MDAAVRQRQFPCRRCGATLAFDPAAGSLKCGHCGTVNEVAQAVAAVQSSDYRTVLTALAEAEAVEETRTIGCTACGAEVGFDANLHSDCCPFCGSPVVAEPVGGKRLKPKAVLPFRVSEKKARAALREWWAAAWFAPEDLRQALEGRFTGMFLPYWTYDCVAYTQYGGKRAEANSEGGDTDWRTVSGQVRTDFHNLAVCASNSLPLEFEEGLAPWPSQELVSYEPGYLAGFRSETYQFGVEGGFALARDRMKERIERDIRDDIGGRDQRIEWTLTIEDEIAFKHALLPVWIASYRHRGRSYRVVVNGATGKVQADRPWDPVKIAVVLLGLAAAVAAVAWVLVEP